MSTEETVATRADWESAAAGVLRKAGRLGADDPDTAVWERLTRTTLDGIAVRPLGTADDLDGLTTAGRPDRTEEWDVRTVLDEADAVAGNAQALADLDHGATSLWVRADPDTDLARLLDGVLLDLAPVVLDAVDDPERAARSLLALGADLHPGTNLGLPAEPGRDVSGWVDLARTATDEGILAFVVDASAVHDRGASDAQELGWAMAAAASCLRSLESVGIGPITAAGLVEFRFAASVEQLPTIAKLRAARRLWARVLELSGVEAPTPVRLHAVTSRAMTTRYDPWVNLLRTTVATFAAGVGGADAVTVEPFDAALGRPGVLGRRIARNTSPVLMWESHLARVSDPVGGSFAVERLTDDLAVAGWAELGRIESDGLPAFEERVAAVVATRDREIATRRRPLTGVSEFPNLAEPLPEREPHLRPRDVAAWAAPYESLRDAPPAAHVFLGTMGPVAAHTARAGFAANLLAAGGITSDPAGATDGPDALVAAHDGQPVACLAGTDAAYDAWGAEAAAALRTHGVTHVVVAGRPRDWADDSCATGVDALAFLTRTREALA